MLQFLPMIIGGLQLASQLSAMKNASKMPARTAEEEAALQGLANADRLTKSALNPNDVIARNLRDSEMKYLTSQTQRGLTDLLNADRRAQLLGRRSYFNPERRDESISQYLTRTGESNAETARVNSLNNILKAIDSYRGSSTGYRLMIPYGQQANANKASKLPNMLGAGADILSQFGGGTAKPWMNPDLQTSNISSMLGGY